MVPRHISQPFYKSKAWRKCRAGYIKSVGGLCERCLKSGIIKSGYIVHHKVYLTEENISDASVSLSWNNLEYLCFNHHQQEHFKVECEVEKDLMFDETGNLVQRSNFDPPL